MVKERARLLEYVGARTVNIKLLVNKDRSLFFPYNCFIRYDPNHQRKLLNYSAFTLGVFIDFRTFEIRRTAKDF